MNVDTLPPQQEVTDQALEKADPKTLNRQRNQIQQVEKVVGSRSHRERRDCRCQEVERLVVQARNAIEQHLHACMKTYKQTGLTPELELEASRDMGDIVVAQQIMSATDPNFPAVMLRLREEHERASWLSA